MSESAKTNAVIRFEPDGYDVRRSWLMGRQVAGNGFLRAAVQERAPGPLHCYTPSQRSAEAFGQMVRAFDPGAESVWIRASQLQKIGPAAGVLYLADATVPTFARSRLGVGVASYSICGVTHTTATSGTMREIADLVTAPVAPWDALVCTSQAVVETVRRVHEAEVEALRWRLGTDVKVRLPQLPVIPLGVHCADFEFTGEERQAARDALGVGPDDIVALFVGRLTFSGKHHPFAMYHGLQAAAERTGRKLVLVQCGWSPNEAIESAFVTGPQLFSPDVRAMVVDGRVEENKRNAWAAADIFMSLSDGIQETFGLTPIEAMAAGLPCVVTDWNGYKDTVRDGIDGFRVPTWAPAAGKAGAALMREQQVAETNYDGYLWLAATATSVDLAALADRLVDLIQDPDLRRRMGEAGRARARQTYEWSRVIGQYQALWAELNARRQAALADPQEAAWIAAAPKAAAGWLDPFHVFGHYPTALVTTETRLSLTHEGTAETYAARRAHMLFGGLRVPDPVALAVLQRLGEGSASVAEIAAAAGLGAEAMVYIVANLAKMGLVRLG